MLTMYKGVARGGGGGGVEGFGQTPLPLDCGHELSAFR